MMVMRLFRPLSTSGRTPLLVVRLPGELTGSDTTGPTPPPRRRTLVHLRLGGDSPQVGWFPGSPSQPRAATAVTRRDTRMDTGLVHRHGHLSGHTNHTRRGPPNFQPGCRDIFVTGRQRVSHESHQPHLSHSVHRSHAHADSMAGGSTAVTSRNGGTRPPAARVSSARHSSSARVSSGGGPSSTVTTQS